MSAKQTLKINEVEVTVGPCLHCGLSASEGDALRALEDWSKWFGDRPLCAVYGAPIGIPEVILGHQVVGKDPGVTSWKVKFAIFNDCVNLTGFGGTPVRVHSACARTAMPYADWDSMDGATHIEEGRGSMPWDSPALRAKPHGS